ncbi:hypothetical protein [Derxia gummosa]|uniref:Uncharacterized protein n=1 Tax=Derxia gummosa DSM 723 TaxID=1121388 RepID=A0A8B6X8Q3_9BURK|nr:hypothetical protein [Derxia gummosa]
MHYFCKLSPRGKWSYTAMRVRCALHPEYPDMIEQFVRMGAFLAQRGHVGDWEAAEHTVRVLLDSATDAALPPPWRERCLSHVGSQLELLDEMALTGEQRGLARWHRQRAELAFD